ELSTPCMMFAIMIESVIMPRLGAGTNVSPLTADPPRAHIIPAGSPPPARGFLSLPSFDPSIAVAPGYRRPAQIGRRQARSAKAAARKPSWSPPVWSRLLGPVCHAGDGDATPAIEDYSARRQ